MAGETVLTATSHGVSKYPPDMVLLWENLYKDAVCHRCYDVCPDGPFLPQNYSTDSSFPPRQGHHVDNHPKGDIITKTVDTVDAMKKADRSQGIASILRTLDQQCINCKPVTPLECITSCNVYKLRSEFRRLCETMENPNFMKDLLNVLKNDTRLHILQAIANGHFTLGRLQQELKKAGHLHSQDTIAEEYLQPLLLLGLASENQDQFYATAFGGKLSELVENLPEFAKSLPAHSECYEENILKALLTGPRTFEEIEALVSSKIVSRILKRLKIVGLIETPEERDYIFFFKSKRDPTKENLSATENKVYSNIDDEGISAKKIAAKTNLSLRRTYKYLRGLKGKKLVFTRKTPKSYALTEAGERLAWLLNELHALVQETLSFSAQFSKHKENS
jgi:predicted transcriptional regulator